MNESRTDGAAGGRRVELTWLLWALLGVVLVGHFASLSGPGVMNADSYAYVGIAESVHAGAGFVARWARVSHVTVEGGPTHWTPGYPAILAVLMRLGAGSRFTYQMVNFSALLAGLAILAARLGRRGLPQSAQLVVVLLCLLSLPVLYSVIFILSDCLFFLGVMVTVELLERGRDAAGGERVRLLALASLSLAASSLVRLAGLTLLPALLVTVFQRQRHEFPRGRRLLAIGGSLLAGFLITVWVDTVVLKTGYLAETRWFFVQAASRYGGARWLSYLTVRNLTSVGQYLFNLETRGLEGLTALFALAGGAGLALLAIGLAAGLRALRPTEIFAATYLGMMAFYPYPAFGHRYWLPAVPIAIGLVTLWVRARRDAATRVLGIVFVVAFCSLGARVMLWRMSGLAHEQQPLGERLIAPAPSHR